ncbi:Gfo/Idh/MocA family protein [Nakamurella sp. GG22]
MIGHAFMGAAHSDAWRTVAHVMDVPAKPVMAVVVGRRPAAAATAGARLGWAESSTDWQSVVHREDIDLVDICTPGDSLAEIAIAALRAGKHVLCEKPLGNTLAEAAAMADAARAARLSGVRAMIGFNYRRVPALALAADLVRDGKVGEIRHVRGLYLQNWLSDPATPMSWRLEVDRAGSGALGDLGAHVIDLTWFLTGQRLTQVTGRLHRFVPQRPLPDDPTRTGEVTVEDAATFSGQLAGGGFATFKVSRVATGHKNSLRIETNGTKGSIVFDVEQFNDLWFYDATEPDRTAGFRRVVVTEPIHPYLSNWYPPGHVLGWDTTFVHEIGDLVGCIAAGVDPQPGFDEGVAAQEVIDAVITSDEAALRSC